MRASAVAWMCVRVCKAGVEVAVGGANAIEATSCERTSMRVFTRGAKLNSNALLLKQF